MDILCTGMLILENMFLPVFNEHSRQHLWINNYQIAIASLIMLLVYSGNKWPSIIIHNNIQILPNGDTIDVSVLTAIHTDSRLEIPLIFHHCTYKCHQSDKWWQCFWHYGCAYYTHFRTKAGKYRYSFLLCHIILSNIKLFQYSF